MMIGDSSDLSDSMEVLNVAITRRPIVRGVWGGRRPQTAVAAGQRMSSTPESVNGKCVYPKYC
jgi:hypothetical protein